MPTSVARVFVRTRPSRTVTVLTGALALGLPLAAGVALVSLVGWGWLVATGVLLLGCGGMLVTRPLLELLDDAELEAVLAHSRAGSSPGADAQGR